MTKSSPALDTLAADFMRHGAWLRRLANGLVLDGNESDDLLQEAWLVAAGAARRPARPGREWFGGVLRNVARAGRRATGRRREREARVVAEAIERSAQAATSEERVAREQRLLELVGSLPKSQRDAVVARYFDGLSPAAIARRDGLSADAVRSRLKRGLEELRSCLERERHGLHGLVLWLAPLARGRRADRLVPEGVVVAAASCAAVAVVALVGIAAHGAWAPPRLDAVAAGAALAPVVAASGSVAGATRSGAPSASTAVRTPVAVREGARSDPVQKACRIHGRVVDVDGAPVKGARVVADGSNASAERVEVFGLPAAWQAPEVLTDDEGAFELRFVPPQAFQFRVAIAHEGFAELAWRWGRIPEGAEQDLGTAVLPQPAVVEGHIVGIEGQLLVDSWSVQASLRDGLPEHAGLATKVVDVDPASGTFRLEGLTPGLTRIDAIHRRGDRAEGQAVTTTPLEVTPVVLRFAEPDPSTTIRLTIASDGLTGPAAAQLADGAVRAIGADGKVYACEPLAKRGWTYTTGVLPKGSYQVEVDDERFATWSQSGVRPGEKVRVELAGRAQLRLTLLDPDGAPVPRYRLGVRATEPVMVDAVVELLPAGAPPPPGGLFTGLVPGAVDVTLDVDGYPQWRGEVRGLRDGRTVDLRVQLEHPRPLTGRVLHADGRSASGGTVEVTRGRVAGHAEPGTSGWTAIEVDGEQRSVHVPYRDAAAELAADGSFDLGPIAGQRAVLRVRVGDWLCHDIDLALEGLELPLLVTLPPPGAIDGRVLFDGERLGELRVALRREGADRSLPPVPCPIDEEGHFVLGPVQPGTYWLQLVGVQRTDAPDAEARAVEPNRRLARRRIEVRPGAPTECELDFGHPRSGVTVTVSVTLAGVPAPPGTTVRLAPTERFDALGYAVDSHSATIEAGAARFERVAASTYTVTVAGEPNWSRARDAAVRVTGGDEVRVDFDVDVVRRTLRVVDPEGRAVVGRRVGLRPPGSSTWLSPCTTDAAGEVELAMPAGAYSLSGSIPADPSLWDGVRLRPFDWQPGEDALVVVLPSEGGQ